MGVLISNLDHEFTGSYGGLEPSFRAPFPGDDQPPFS